MGNGGMALLHLDEVLETVRKFLSSDEGSVVAYLFGSYSRGDFTDESDVDVLVISERPLETRERLYDLSWEIQMRYGIPVSFVVIPEERWRRGLTPLKEVALREGIVIWERRRGKKSRGLT